MGKLKIGVFGGARGNVMIEVLMHRPDAVLVAVCDKYEPLLEQVKRNAAAAGLDVACYTSFDEFIKHDMDAVVLANYATQHAPFAIRCMNAGMHVLSEVLPCESMAQAVELIETVERTGKVYAYAENYCYMDTTFEMWRRYKEGTIGEIHYADCSYIHDCTSIWANITYGERDHWRNRLYPTFYCTHSLGPIITITGRRPVRVVGFENPPIEQFYELGHAGGHAGGIEMVVLDNGANVRSIHGPLKREPAFTRYEVYGEKGTLQTAEDGRVRCYVEGEQMCSGNAEVYAPQKFVAVDAAGAGPQSHGGSDFYPTHCFIQKILGKPDGEWCIDVYQAVDMGICGILAYRSILNGNAPVDVPDLRDPAQRDAYRNDRACTSPDEAGDQLLPVSSYPLRELPDEVFARMRDKFLGH